MVHSRLVTIGGLFGFHGPMLSHFEERIFATLLKSQVFKKAYQQVDSRMSNVLSFRFQEI